MIPTVADGLVDVLAVALGIVGLVYTIMPTMFKTSVAITRALLFGVVGGLIAAAGSVVVSTGVLGACAIANLIPACRSPQPFLTVGLESVSTAMIFAMALGILISIHSHQGIRSRAPSVVWNTATLSIGLLLVGAAVIPGWGTGQLRAVLTDTAIVYWFVAGSVVVMPVLALRTQWLLCGALILVYIVAGVTVAVLSGGDESTRLAGEVVIIAVLWLSVGFFPFFFGLVLCNPPADTSGEPSIGRFLSAVAAAFVCGLVLPLLSLLESIEPYHLLSMASWPVAMGVASFGGQGRLLLHRPRVRWVVRDGRYVLDWDVALLRFAHGMLVGFMFIWLALFLFEYDGSVVGSALRVIQPDEKRLLALAVVGLITPVGSFPFGLAIGVLTVAAPWLSHKLRINHSAFVVMGVLMTAAGAILLIRTSLRRLLGM